MDKETKKQETEKVEKTKKEQKEEVKEEKKKNSELESLKNDYQKLNDNYVRVLAEYDNFRKRTAKEKDAIWADSKADACKKMLDISDNFERALAIECKDENFKKGIEMIQKSLLDAFTKLEIQSFGEKGDPFDPNIHNAVMHVDDESLGENVIAEVFQKGYKINEKILRAATVKVAN